MNKEIYIMLLPGLLFMLVVRYIPMYGLQIAFKSFDPFLCIWKILNELRIHFFKRIIQTVSYFPHLISWVVIGGLSYSFLGSFGFVNKLFEILGFEQILFYQDPDVWRTILIATETWKTVGWSSILYLAALTAVNTDLYEAIEVDGGGRFKKIWHIDLPVLMPVFAILLILKSADLVSGNFEDQERHFGRENK